MEASSFLSRFFFFNGWLILFMVLCRGLSSKFKTSATHWCLGFGFQDREGLVEFSGPLLCQSNRLDELLEKHERHIRQAVRRSWFQRGNKHFLQSSPKLPNSQQPPLKATVLIPFAFAFAFFG